MRASIDGIRSEIEPSPTMQAMYRPFGLYDMARGNPVNITREGMTANVSVFPSKIGISCADERAEHTASKAPQNHFTVSL